MVHSSFVRRCCCGRGGSLLQLVLRFSTLWIPPLGHHDHVWGCSSCSLWRNWYPSLGGRYSLPQCGFGPVDVAKLQWKWRLLVWLTRWRLWNNWNGLPFVRQRTFPIFRIWPKGKGSLQPWLKPNLRKNPELIPRVLSCQRKSLLLWVTFAHIREMKTGVLAKRDTENAYGSFNHLDFSHYPDSVPHSRSIPQQELCLLPDWMSRWPQATVLLHVSVSLSRGLWVL